MQRTYVEDGNGIYIDVYFEDVRKLHYDLPKTNAVKRKKPNKHDTQN